MLNEAFNSKDCCMTLIKQLPIWVWVVLMLTRLYAACGVFTSDINRCINKQPIQ